MVQYDPVGRLVDYELLSATTRFLSDGIEVAAEVSPTTGAVQKRWVHGPGIDEPLVEYAGSGTSSRSWLHADERGSIVAQSDGSGAVTQVNRYDEYGRQQSTNSGRFQYTGQMWLPEVGVYHYRNRHYQPALGRFLQADPIGYGGGPNLYAYVLNDPVNLIDPLGTRVVWREVGTCVHTDEVGAVESCGTRGVWRWEPDNFPPPAEYEMASLELLMFASDGGGVNAASQSACTTKRMLTTAYNDRGPGADWAYWKNHPEGVGPGTIAVANTAPTPYPFGTQFIVKGNASLFGVAYMGIARDTGAGWDPRHHNVRPDQWIDIWLPGRQANEWGKQWRDVVICPAGS